MTILFGADYKCTPQRDPLVAALKQFAPTTDVVQVNPSLTDYVEVAQTVAAALSTTPNARGLLICGTGIGISIVANKHPNVSAARCLSEQDALDARTINDANLLCLSHNTPLDTNLAILRAFFSTPFPGDERRSARLRKIASLEQSNFK